MRAWPVSLRWLVPVCVAYASLAAFVSWSFTSWTGLSRWTMSPAGPQHTYLNLFSINLATWVGWGALAPIVFWLSDRVPIERARWMRGLAVHAVLSLLVATSHGVAVSSLRVWLQSRWGLEPAWWPSVVEHFFRNVDLHVPVYWGLVGLQHAVAYHHAVRARDVASAQLETRLVEAQLQALHRQVHPHFLFNTLHAISALVHRAPDQAEAMIERLSDMLRVTLASATAQLVPLRQELDFLQTYLDIEQLHFGARLRVEMEVDARTLDVVVPPLVLQPLAENALRHGLAPMPGGGTLRIAARLDAATLVITVQDDGRGPGPGNRATVRGHGIGLANTHARLEALYRGAAALDVSARTGGGTLVALRLPVTVTAESPVLERRAS